ncbi:ANTAR domain-containing response regulator [Neptunicella sp. SCSIO 80796]|uniref:ANTAR domain-containing response regulator n=1 Tax=Neptunicella plasticusilytica TaxID=3117012 RepID=UPI003A4E5BD1
MSHQADALLQNEADNWQPNSIVLVELSSTDNSILKQGLEDFGFTILSQLQDTQHLSSNVTLHLPDVLVLAIDYPDMATIEQLKRINDTHPLPIVMFSEYDMPNFIQRTIKAGVSAFIVDEIQPQRLKSIINVAYFRFIEYQNLKNELCKTREELANRKILERAKGLLMQQKQLNEADAYKLMRKMAMDKGIPIATVAGQIIDVFSLLNEY